MIVILALVSIVEPWSPPAGAYDPGATVAQVCTIGYARAHRHGLARGHRRAYVIDHLFPLELGGTMTSVTCGSNSIPNRIGKIVTTFGAVAGAVACGLVTCKEAVARGRLFTVMLAERESAELLARFDDGLVAASTTGRRDDVSLSARE